MWSASLAGPEDRHTIGWSAPKYGVDQRGRAARANCVHGDIVRQSLAQRVEPRIDVVAQVALGQDHHRPDSDGFHHREIALEAAQIEIPVEPHHQQRRIDVADERLSRAG